MVIRGRMTQEEGGEGSTQQKQSAKLSAGEQSINYETTPSIQGAHLCEQPQETLTLAAAVREEEGLVAAGGLAGEVGSAAGVGGLAGGEGGKVEEGLVAEGGGLGGEEVGRGEEEGEGAAMAEGGGSGRCNSAGCEHGKPRSSPGGGTRRGRCCTSSCARHTQTHRGKYQSSGCGASKGHVIRQARSIIVLYIVLKGIAVQASGIRPVRRFSFMSRYCAATTAISLAVRDGNKQYEQCKTGPYSQAGHRAPLGRQPRSEGVVVDLKTLEVYHGAPLGRKSSRQLIERVGAWRGAVEPEVPQVCHPAPARGQGASSNAVAKHVPENTRNKLATLIMASWMEKGKTSRDSGDPPSGSWKREKPPANTTHSVCRLAMAPHSAGRLPVSALLSRCLQKHSRVHKE